MRVRRLGPLFAFGFLFFVTAAQAQTSAPVTPTRDPQAVAILNQSLQAAGGSQALAAIQDFTASGSITFYWAGQKVSGSVTIKGRGLAQYRMDASVDGGVESLVVNGNNGSVKNIDGSTRTFSPDELVYFASPSFPSTQVMAALQNTSTSISFVGEVTHDGRQVDDVRVQKVYSKADDPLGFRAKLATRDFFIDPATFQVVSSQDSAHPIHILSALCPHEMQFSDYRTVNGVLVPFAITETVCGQTTDRINLSQIVFNTGLTDSDFQQ